MDTDAPPGADTRLVSALVRLYRFSQRLDELAGETLGKSATGNREIGILLALHFDGPQSPTHLADELGMDHSQGSRHLRDLESAGLVSRSADPTDGRRRTVALTVRGRNRVAGFERAVREFLTGRNARAASEIASLLGGRDQASGAPVIDSLEVASRLTAAGGRFVEDAAPKLEQYGVADVLAERFILTLLFAQGALRPKHLARELHASASAVSTRLNHLEDAGLLVRQRGDSRDRRAILVDLTPRGRRAAQVLLDTLADHAEEISVAIAAALTLRSDGAPQQVQAEPVG